MLQETTLAGSAAPAVKPDQAGNPIPDAATVAAFAATLRGQLIRPEDAGYDEARHVWNGSIDRRPGLIVRCAGTADVIASVNFARTHGLLVRSAEAATASRATRSAMAAWSSTCRA